MGTQSLIGHTADLIKIVYNLGRSVNPDPDLKSSVDAEVKDMIQNYRSLFLKRSHDPEKMKIAILEDMKAIESKNTKNHIMKAFQINFCTYLKQIIPLAYGDVDCQEQAYKGIRNLETWYKEIGTWIKQPLNNTVRDKSTQIVSKHTAKQKDFLKVSEGLLNKWIIQRDLADMVFGTLNYELYRGSNDEKRFPDRYKPTRWERERRVVRNAPRHISEDEDDETRAIMERIVQMFENFVRDQER